MESFKLEKTLFLRWGRGWFFSFAKVSMVKPWHRLPRGGPCPTSGNIQGQVGRGSEQPGLVEDVPAHCRGVGLDDL